MTWEKRGVVFMPDGSMNWSKTHAQAPTPVKIDDKTIRIYFSTRIVGTLILSAFIVLFFY